MSTAVILAGGRSRRMGRDKLRLVYGGETLLELAVRRFSAVFDRVYLSVGEADKYPEIGCERAVDLYPGCGPMAGLHAALLKTPDEGVFLAAADLPFADPQAALKIASLCGDSAAALLTDETGRLEPTFGYYKKELLPAAERLLQAGRYKMLALFDEAPLRRVTHGELGALWRDGMLDNINYPEDYEKLVNSVKSGEF